MSRAANQQSVVSDQPSAPEAIVNGKAKESAPIEVRDLPLSRLHDAPWNARKHYDDAAMKELAESVGARGVLVPLLVRPMGSDYEIVAGHRRARAAKAALLSSAPCQVRELGDEEAQLIGLLDNLQRADLTAMEEAEGYQRIFQVAGGHGLHLTPAQLAAKVQKPEGYVRLRLRLLSAEEGVREMLRAGNMPLAHALEIARLEPADQKACLHSLTGWGEMPSISRLRNHIHHQILLDLAKAPFDTKDARLDAAAGSCVDCPKRSGNNTLLFGDVRAKDRCTDPGCFWRKVEAHIDVTIEALTRKGSRVVRLSRDYQRSKSTPKDVLVSSQYNQHISGQACADLATGVMVDGLEAGKTFRVCTARGCKVHGGAAYARPDSPELKAKRAKARIEKECRMRIFRAAVEKAQTVRAVGDDALRQLAAYAIDRGDNYGTTTLMKMLEWPTSLISPMEGPKLLAKVQTLKPAQAVALGLLASVSDALTVNEYSISKADNLEHLVKTLGVNVGAIRKQVADEAAAKAKPAKKAARQKPAQPILSRAARKRIADAQKKRWSKTQKAAKKGGRK